MDAVALSLVSNPAEIKQFVDQQLAIHDNIKAKRKNNNEGLMDEVCGLFEPALYSRPTSTLEPGKRFAEDIWDGYPQLALRMWSQGISGNMIFRDWQWLSQRINVAKLMKEPEVKKYCEARTEQVFWAMRRTNFYEVNPQFCRYAGSIGGYMFPMKNWVNRSIEFVLEDPWYVWVERDIFGRASRVHREINKSIDALAREFGEKSLHTTRRAQLKSPAAMYTEVPIVHGIFPNPEFDALSLDASRKPYIEFYIDQGTRQLMYVDGTDYMVVDWCVERVPRSAYPLTPAMCALTDAYGTDTLSQALYEVALEAGNPAMRVSRSLMKDYETGPGSITWVTDGVKDVVEQIRKQFTWPIPNEERNRILSRLDWWFSVEYFRLLTNLQTGKMPTAYHIQQLQSEKATLLGPQVATFTQQVLDPVVDIVSQEENEYDPIEMPDILQEYLVEQSVRDLRRQGHNITDEMVMDYAQKYPAAWLEAHYTGPLTNIQSQVINSRRYGEALEAMGMMTSLFPEAKYIINQYPFIRNILESTNISAEEIKTPDEFKQVVAEIQAQNDAMQQMEQEKASADAYKKMVRAPEEGSAAQLKIIQAAQEAA